MSDETPKVDRAATLAWAFYEVATTPEQYRETAEVHAEELAVAVRSAYAPVERRAEMAGRLAGMLEVTKAHLDRNGLHCQETRTIGSLLAEFDAIERETEAKA